MMFDVNVTTDLRALEPLVYDQFILLHTRLFGGEYTSEVEAKLRDKKSVALTLALEGKELLGFKLGYELKTDTFYSWTGGVKEKYRRRGVAMALMKAQHEWCRRQGYTKIQTKTKNKWRSMLILNINSGFDVIETYVDREGETKIVLEKRLTPDQNEGPLPALDFPQAHWYVARNLFFKGEIL